MSAYLRAAGAGLLLDVSGPALPRVLHWGRDLGALPDAAAEQAAAALIGPAPRGGLDEFAPLPLLPTEHDGWLGTPGLAGHRAGADAIPRLRLVRPVTVRPAPAGGGTVEATAGGDGLEVTVTLRLDELGVLHVDASVTNTAAGDYDLASLLPLLPVPERAGELLDLTGRWCRERTPQRGALRHGTHLRAGRRGRSGHDTPFVLVAGTPGFAFRTGEVWATHVAWSGDTTFLAERLPEGAGGAGAVLASGELLRPGEIRLGPGETYTAPTALFAWSGDGLDGLSARWHRMLRARPSHPSSPRPVVLNIWEAVYFEQDLTTLRQLADVAASIGVERFVIDDGWFGRRRNDRAGLGDWYVSPDVWPDGLRPLTDHVHRLGMQAGLWFEPEMANPDSDVLREHPDWLLTPDAREWRHQQLLDLANPDVFAYLLERLDAVVTEAGIDYVKWDHNRDLHVALHREPDGRRVPGVHRQTAALYRLLDELRSRHPALEVESCASGGGRVDLGILEHTDRVWTSDCNDAVERQRIQRWTGLLLPPELCGAHVGPRGSHTTGRQLDLAFRCATALFGHAGIEWDLTACTDAQLATLRAWIALYKQRRTLLHTGDVVRADLPGSAAGGSATGGDGSGDALLHGVVSRDRSEALFSYARLDTVAELVPGRVPLPGLDPERSYRVRVLDELGTAKTKQRLAPPWLTRTSTLPGSLLTEVGLPMPVLVPGAALLLDVRAT